MINKKCIGVDIGGTSIKLGMFETDGTVLDKWEVTTRTEDGGRHILQDVAASIENKMKENSLTKEDIQGVGMGIPGPVLPDGHVVVCVNLGWKNCNPQKELSELLGGIPVKSGNDANVAALGEMWQGGGKGYSDVVMITLGTGVGSGVILNEKIVTGRHGMAGEIGHIHVRSDEKEACNCGGVGCLEQIASATGIAREAKRTLEAKDMPSILRDKGGKLTAKDVLDAAKAGDALALEVMETVARYLGLALSQVVMTIDPQMFVIGGGVSKAGQFLIDMISRYYDYYTPIAKEKAGLCLAKLGNDAGIYGAARMILE